MEKRDLNETKFDYTPCMAGDTRMAEWGQFLGGSVIIWDNRRTMHRARPLPSEEPRDMRRSTLRGEGPTAEQAAA